MNLENSSQSTVQLYRLESHEVDSKDIQELSSLANAHTATIEQPVSAGKAEAKDLTTNFFIIGGVINITMILAYFVWAYFQWKKIDKRNKKAESE